MTKNIISGASFGIFGSNQEYSRVVIEGNDSFLSFSSGKLHKPFRIFVDIDDSSLATSLKPVHVFDGLVNTIRFGQFRPNISRVVIDLEKDAPYRIFALAAADNRPYRLIVDVERNAAEAILPSPIEGPIEGSNGSKTVVIDPGHGGRDPGAIGVKGIMEKDVVLSISLFLGQLLNAANYQVFFTRTEDVTVSLPQRVQIINNHNPDLAISVHCNSFSLPSANGIETFYHPTKNSAKPLAEKLQQELIAAFGWTNRGVKTANFHILREPVLNEVVLPEIGFLTNQREGVAMASEENQKKAAEALVKGIHDFLS